MNWNILGVTLLQLFVASQARAELAKLGTFYDFMVRDVCIDSDGIIQRSLIPGDAGCTSTRNMASTDPKFYYYSYIYPANASGGKCSGQPYVAWVSYPEVRNGVRRVVMYQDRGCVSIGSASFGTLDDTDGMSVRWYEDGKYAFLMSSWSPVAQSYWITNYCSANPTNSKRFYNGWIASTAALPATGTVSALVNSSASGSVASSDAASIPTGCPPNGYRNSLVVFGRDSFTYKSGKTLDTIISQKYTNGVPGATYPGNAEGLERIYYTDQFGITRWEKWAREDNVDTDGTTAAKSAADLYAGGKCSRPYDFKSAITSDMTSGNLIDDGSLYKEAYVYKPTNDRYVWFLTDCADFSNTALVPGGFDRPPISTSFSSVLWN
ncbi:MAG: hypothetical protein EON58_02725 [Alphaproteobacteria bacterium]|nr:MAG: hypothetical protein EON58_02725 [Alphaproteobacteria bacterium]